MKTKRKPQRKRKPINAASFMAINHEPLPPAPRRSRERIFYDNLIMSGVTFKVEGERVIGYMPNKLPCIYPLENEIAKRDQAIKRFIAEAN